MNNKFLNSTATNTIQHLLWLESSSGFRQNHTPPMAAQGISI